MWKTPQSKSSICDFLLPDLWCSMEGGDELGYHLSIIFSSPSSSSLLQGSTCCDAQAGGCFLVRMVWTCRFSSGWDWWPWAELLGRGVEGNPVGAMSALRAVTQMLMQIWGAIWETKWCCGHYTGDSLWDDSDTEVQTSNKGAELGDFFLSHKQGWVLSLLQKILFI